MLLSCKELDTNYVVILFRFLVADMYLGDGDIVAVLQQLVGEC